MFALRATTKLWNKQTIDCIIIIVTYPKARNGVRAQIRNNKGILCFLFFIVFCCWYTRKIVIQIVAHTYRCFIVPCRRRGTLRCNVMCRFTGRNPYSLVRLSVQFTRRTSGERLREIDRGARRRGRRRWYDHSAYVCVCVFLLLLLLLLSRGIMMIERRTNGDDHWRIDDWQTESV